MLLKIALGKEMTNPRSEPGENENVYISEVIIYSTSIKYIRSCKKGIGWGCRSRYSAPAYLVAA